MTARLRVPPSAQACSSSSRSPRAAPRLVAASGRGPGLSHASRHHGAHAAQRRCARLGRALPHPPDGGARTAKRDQLGVIETLARRSRIQLRRRSSIAALIKLRGRIFRRRFARCCVCNRPIQHGCRAIRAAWAHLLRTLLQGIALQGRSCFLETRPGARRLSHLGQNRESSMSLR
jgi:hypothetical protein